MKKSQVALVMAKVFEECGGLRSAGQKEYAYNDEEAFSNFIRVAADLGITKEMALLTYFLKHKDGVVAHVKGHTSQREDVRGRINDMIVYLCLLRAMIDENDGIEYFATEDVKSTILPYKRFEGVAVDQLTPETPFGLSAIDKESVHHKSKVFKKGVRIPIKKRK